MFALYRSKKISFNIVSRYIIVLFFQFKLPLFGHCGTSCLAPLSVWSYFCTYPAMVFYIRKHIVTGGHLHTIWTGMPVDAATFEQTLKSFMGGNDQQT